ncbi:hypothetical protein [Alkalicoccobacillus porphyridii]|uniref:Uncharacterized protein n=1 Tax=Alkalicoccobacillus porphyridii TaxID=2597270 RepID=A0A553ZWC6_9BACI|nr:hypothetical protein [Alkalicoccobacillus porphyridii]TSB45732.1 hypothetical protein FN960_14690 [Alkalicoccobacillus porphyridii]
MKKQWFLITSIVLSILSIFVMPSSEKVTGNGVTFSYGFPVRFVEYFSIEGVEPARWELLNITRSLTDLGAFAVCVAILYLFFLFINYLINKLLNNRQNKSQAERN